MAIERLTTQGNVPYSTIPAISALNQKNYYANYLKRDDQFRMVRNTRETVANNLKRRKMVHAARGSSTASNATPDDVSTTAADDDDDDEDGDADDLETDRVMVIHPGSESIKLGWSTDIDATKVLNLIAHKRSPGAQAPETLGLDPKRHQVERKNQMVDMVESDTFMQLREPIKESFRERMKYYNRRMLPNSTEQCRLFNKKGQCEELDDDDEEDEEDEEENAPHAKQTKLIDSSYEYNYVVGQDVLKITDLDNWIIRSPFSSSSQQGFNDTDMAYSVPEEVLGDIQLILEHSFSTHFGLKLNEHQNVNVMLVLPNIYSKVYVESLMQMLLVRMDFKNVAFIQESLSASFGAGLSSACIVDIGHRGIHIACVEDGVVMEHSRIELDYGFSDINRMMAKCLINQQMKYPVNMLNVRDLIAMGQCMQDCVTFDDEQVNIKTIDLVIKEPGQKKKRHMLKVWDDVMICPMGMFYPEVFQEPKEESVVLEHECKDGQLLSGLSPVRSIRSSPVMSTRSGKFEGYINESNPSALQTLQTNGINLNNLPLKSLLEVICEVYHDSDPNTAGGGGPKKVKGSKFNNLAWLPEGVQPEAPKEAEEDGDEEDEEEAKKGPLDTLNLRKNMTPLDVAIAQSICLGASEDGARMEKLWSNICLAGGGGHIGGIENMLTDRLHMSRINSLCNTKIAECVKLMKEWRKNASESLNLDDSKLGELEAIITSGSEAAIDVMLPGELNPSTISWKGACVYAKIRVIEEMWVSQKDWELLGGRSIRYGGLFVS